MIARLSQWKLLENFWEKIAINLSGSISKDIGIIFFSKIPDLSNFTRQAGNLHIIKQLLQEHLAKNLNAFNDSLYIIDGLPIPVYKFARAHFIKILKVMQPMIIVPLKKNIIMGFMDM